MEPHRPLLVCTESVRYEECLKLPVPDRCSEFQSKIREWDEALKYKSQAELGARSGIACHDRHRE